MIGARFRADDGSNFVTNYMGCKASRVVFNFEEGNPVNYGVDFIAQDMRHNIGEDSGLGASAEKTTKYKALTASTAVGLTIPPNLSTHTRVTEQPYFFSKVTLKFYAYEIARFRRFSLTIDNQLDPRYYLNQNESGSPIEGRQVLTEILEGRRNVSFSGSLDMDDNGNGVIEPLELGGQLWENGRITFLFGSSGGLSGEIPQNINSLDTLFVLSLSNNHLSGILPESLYNITNLSILHLNGNNLSGEISLSICDITNLNWESDEAQFLPNKSYLFDNKLCPPYPDCGEGSITSEDSQNTEACNPP